MAFLKTKHFGGIKVYSQVCSTFAATTSPDTGLDIIIKPIYEIGVEHRQSSWRV